MSDYTPLTNAEIFNLYSSLADALFLYKDDTTAKNLILAELAGIATAITNAPSTLLGMNILRGGESSLDFRRFENAIYLAIGVI
jgi:hypothetical protein